MEKLAVNYLNEIWGSIVGLIVEINGLGWGFIVSVFITKL